MNIYLDIETIPTQPEDATKAEIAKTIEAPAKMTKAETIADWHNGVGKYEGVKARAIEDAYRKTALDGAKGEIITCVVSDGDEFITELRTGDNSEPQLLNAIFSAIDSLCDNHGSKVEPYFIGHHIQWDLKFLWHRAVILGVKPSFELPFGGRHKSDFYDNMQAWAGFNQRISQDNLCKALGMEGKRHEVTGSNVWDFVKAGQVEKVAEYNKHDVEDVIAIHKRINFL